MRRHADNLYTLFVRLTVSLRSRKAGEERRMNVNNLVFKTPNEVRRKNLHETREHDKINLVLVEKKQRLLLRFDPVVPGDHEKRHFMILDQRGQFAAI